MLKPLCVAAVLALLGSSQIRAQTNSVYVDVAPCLAMEATADRQACFVAVGEEVRSVMARDSAAAVPTIPAAAPEIRQQPAAIAETAAGSPQAKAVEEFGLEQPSAPVQRAQNARVLANENGDQELVGTIAKLNERMPNMWDVTLANDQVWRQVNSEIYRLQEGMEVRIYPSPFSGAFRMSARGKNGFIQVRRIR